MNKTIFPAAALFVALLLAACGGGGDLKPTPTDAPATPCSSSAASAASCGPTGSAIAAIKREGKHAFASFPERVIDPNKTYTAKMETSRGVITIQLDAKDAPNTVNNFVYLSCEGFYDGLNFHRVVKTPTPFVIQGGDPRGDGRGGPGYIFNDEVSPNIRHDAGVISMANSGPNTNGSQFFITLAAAPNLNDKYNAFGRVTAGMEVANAIVQGDKILAVSITES